MFNHLTATQQLQEGVGGEARRGTPNDPQLGEVEHHQGELPYDVLGPYLDLPPRDQVAAVEHEALCWIELDQEQRIRIVLAQVLRLLVEPAALQRLHQVCHCFTLYTDVAGQHVIAHGDGNLGQANRKTDGNC